ncbi:MAG: hypothetical protein ACRDQU_01645 [Pseudonocardiaceae bacterium]
MPAPNARRPPLADPVAQRPSRQQQRGAHQRVPVNNQLQPGDTATQIGADGRQGHVDHDGVQRHDEEPEHSRG